MIRAKINKIIAVAILITQFAFWPLEVFAVVSTAPGAVNAISTNDTGSLIANTTFDAAFSPIKANYLACNASIKTFEAADNAAQLGFSFGTLIGGNGALVAQLTKQVAAYNIYLNPPCLTSSIVNLDLLTAPNVYTSGLKQQLLTQMKADAQIYQDKLKTAHARLNIASQDVWKALMVTVLMNTTKVVANQLVNKLVNSYKVANAKKYVDSVATLMYDNQFIADNFPDNQGQMMARAILENPLLRNQIQPGIFAAADNALNYNGASFNPVNLQYSDPDFYAKMALVGTAQASPYYLQSVYVANLDAARSKSQSAAQQLVSQGNGYKAPVSCSGSLAQQAQIDSQTKAASNVLANRKKLLTDLENAKTSGLNVSDIDIKKAKADFDFALNSWNRLPYTVTGQNSSGNSVQGRAAIKLCEAVSSPAVLVNQGIDAVFKSLNLGNYNNNNLPGFLGAISGMATQIGSNLVLGGITGNSAYKINEDQLINQAVGLASGIAVGALNSNLQANLVKGVNLQVNRNDSADTSSGKGYEISWDVLTEKLPLANYVSVTGPGIDKPSKLPLTGTFAALAPQSGAYTVTVYDVAGKSLITATQDFTNPTTPSTVSGNNSGNPNTACGGNFSSLQACTAQTGDASYCSAICGSVVGSNFTKSPQVAGAATYEPSFTIRGGTPNLGLRGLPN